MNEWIMALRLSWPRYKKNLYIFGCTRLDARKFTKSIFFLFTCSNMLFVQYQVILVSYVFLGRCTHQHHHSHVTGIWDVINLIPLYNLWNCLRCLRPCGNSQIEFFFHRFNWWIDDDKSAICFTYLGLEPIRHHVIAINLLLNLLRERNS